MKNTIEVFKIKNTEEHLNSIGIYKGEEIIDATGTLIKKHSDDIYELEVKIKYVYNDNIVMTRSLYVNKENLTLKST
jgi:hypothetical protein